MRCLIGFTLLLSLTPAAPAADNDWTRVLAPGKTPEDSRLGKARTLDDKDFFFTPPTTPSEWNARRQELRRQVLVANGLWPLPEKMPLNPVIHGKIDRDEYTIEKVFFTSYPGHYVTGNLYRPKGKSGKLPAVLSPHGHWGSRTLGALNNGRMYDAGDKAAQDQVKQGAEKTLEGAHFPLQARCAQLARMGCVVFHYDMVGYADSQPIAHGDGFLDVEAQLRLQSFMGLQTWNSIRALDFVLALPDVDPKRVGVTGASGGGTQTIQLCAVDDRPAAAFPAVMVSTAMQGGCVCENCNYLRQATGNVELIAIFAPKPLGMTGADDWTVNIETKGFPELRALYRLLGAEDHVMARCFPQFKHNYNQVSREVMYNWFNKHLRLGQTEPVVEKPFVPVPPRELSVYDQQHPVPSGVLPADRLRQHLTEMSDKQISALHPKDTARLARFRQVVGGALGVLVHDHLPLSGEVDIQRLGVEEHDGIRAQKLLLGRSGEKEQLPAMLLTPKKHDGSVVVWVHPAGKTSLLDGGQLSAPARRLLDEQYAILALDVIGTGEFPQQEQGAVARNYAGFTFGYNRPLLANRVHDILTAVGVARALDETRAVHLTGIGKAGPWVLLARALCGDAVTRTVADGDQFRFENVKNVNDPMMLPGALKYGGLPAFAALCAPGELFVSNCPAGVETLLKDAYQAAGQSKRLHLSRDKLEWPAR
jgi:dienelactone hydrolase